MIERKAAKRGPFAIVLGVAAIVLLVFARASSTPAWPDDWDGIGFTLAVSRFDMDRFQPHAPGYPVYVAMLKIAALALRDPIRAANAVAVACGAGAIALGWAAARRAFDPERAWWIAIAIAITPLVWRCSTAIGSEAPALLFAALIAYGLARDGWIAITAVGIGVGMGLGVRLSWAPLYVAMLFTLGRPLRLRAIGIAIAAALTWAVPFVAIVGLDHLRALAVTHAAGHFTRWGGTTLSDPGVARLAYLARDLFVDGLGAGTDGLGIAIGLATLALAKTAFDAWRENDFRHARSIAIAVIPYLVWIAIGQNLREQPRHALPLVAAIAGGLALAATHVTRTRTLGILFLVLLSLRTFGDANERLETPPPGAQLVERVRALPSSTRVFGGPSARFFALESPALAERAQTAGAIGDVSLAVGRMRELPSRVLVTGELDLRGTAYPLVPFATLCRPARIERRAPCITVHEWRAPFLPK